jgi:S-adenosylmethionine decarboxylase
VALMDINETGQTRAMPRIAPEIVRQRLLVEGYFTTEVDEQRVEDFLHGIAAHLDLRTYGRPAIFAPGGEGSEDNQGYDAFLPLIDSGISVYVWSGPRFVSAVLFTCKAFDEDEAIAFTSDFFGLSTLEHCSF